MVVDSLFSLAIEEIDGQKALRFFASEGAILGETATPLFAADLGELCDLAGVRAEVRDRFARARDRTIFSNGWQSWCYAGELASDEWVARARIVPNINVYTDGPGPREARDEVLSHFLTYIRAGEARLVLASKGSVEKATPPIAFRLDRSTLALRA